MFSDIIKLFWLYSAFMILIAEWTTHYLILKVNMRPRRWVGKIRHLQQTQTIFIFISGVQMVEGKSSHLFTKLHHHSLGQAMAHTDTLICTQKCKLKMFSTCVQAFFNEKQTKSSIFFRKCLCLCKGVEKDMHMYLEVGTQLGIVLIYSPPQVWCTVYHWCQSSLI